MICRRAASRARAGSLDPRVVKYNFFHVEKL